MHMLIDLEESYPVVKGRVGFDFGHVQNNRGATVICHDDFIRRTITSSGIFVSLSWLIITISKP